MTKILLADNDAEFLKSRAEILEKSGYPIVAVNSLDDARKKLKDNHCDLAIIDVRLLDDNDPNDFSGLALVRELNPDISIILYSGYIRDEDIKDFNAEGRTVDFLFSKDHEPMLQAIQNALYRWRSRERQIAPPEARFPSASISSIFGILFLVIGAITGIFGIIIGKAWLFLLTLMLIVMGGIFAVLGVAQSANKAA
jgi:CheY-like chemotaxis protein